MCYGLWTLFLPVAARSEYFTADIKKLGFPCQIIVRRQLQQTICAVILVDGRLLKERETSCGLPLKGLGKQHSHLVCATITARKPSMDLSLLIDEKWQIVAGSCDRTLNKFTAQGRTQGRISASIRDSTDSWQMEHKLVSMRQNVFSLLFKCQTMKSYLNWIQCFPTPRSGAGVIFQFHSISSQMTYNNVRMFAQISMTAM